MAWTKPTFYLSMIFVALVFFVSLANIGSDLINKDRIDLNEKSVDYILEVQGTNSDNGFDTYSETASGETNAKSVLDSDDDSQVSESADFLSTLFIKKERASEPTNLFKVAYNIPTSIIVGLGLPVAEFSHIINILSIFLFVSILVMVWTQIIRT